MGTRSLVALAVAVVVGLGWTRSAAADPKAEIAQKSKDAMESYDLMDYEAARKLLAQALTLAKRAKLDRDPIAARLYLNLGLASFAGGDHDGAKLSFASAVQIDPKIQIAPEYRQPALVALLDQARAELASEPTPPAAPPATPPPVMPPPAPAPAATPPGPPGVDCAAVKGLQHAIIDTAKTNASQPIEALVGGDISPVRVSVMYRPEGATAYTEGRLTKQGECRYVGQIPASALKGSLVHYYVAAYDANNRVIVGRGSAGSPNIMELVEGPPPRSDEEEDPISGLKKTAPRRGGGSTGGGVSKGVTVPGKPARMFVGLAGGTGVGYVTGKTEFDNEVEDCCIGNSLIVIMPEFGYRLNRRLSIGAAARLGIPIGANLTGHSTLAPGGMVRVRYALSRSGEGVRVMGQLGAGILRHTIKLNNALAGMDTDIVAQGPLLVGAGVGYSKRVAGNLEFLADLSALGAIAVVKELGSAPNLNSGVSADLSIGLAFGF
jgi:hypothetical protein